MSHTTLIKWDASVCHLEALPLWKRAIRYAAGLLGFNVFEPQWITPDSATAHGHPACLEIIKIQDGEAPVTIYKRKD